ncbi:MAG: dehydrogenase [Planctomycetaceae bacterium]|nr:dehydrogenase [Planctomycetaceae bacterium]
MRTLAFSLLLLVVAPTTPEAAQPAKPVDGPVPTKDAAAKMTVPEGFKVTMFAGEPDIVQPIAFTFDDRGRMWVVECLSYPRWSKDGKGSDRVVILEDTDGDGTFNKKTVFMDNGVNLSGIELGFGGVWLCSSPNLLFVPILEGDKPGKPEVALDGWNMTDTKHNIFNSLGWGPDGWLYGCNGIQAKAWVGTPGTPKEKRPYMDCGVWRYHPTRKIFEPVAHGTTNPFGLDWDENGEMFITNCVIDHLFHFVPGGHYQRMYGQDANPHTYGLMKSCVDYRHWAGGDWTSSRGTGVGGKPEHSDAGGGHAHSGCAIYLGDNFPAEYRNTLFTANIHGNRLNNDGLQRTPSGMKGVRRKDFLFANDSWFRGICVKCGPNGALYVSDWCDTGECHNYDKCDTSNGRIFRVSYGDPKQWKGDVSKLTDAELVKMTVTASNEWFSRKARRVLQERAVGKKLRDEPLAALRAMLKDEKEPTHRLRAMWALATLEELAAVDLTPFLQDKSDVVRAWTIRLLIEGEPSIKWGEGEVKEKATIDSIFFLMKPQPPDVLLAIASACERSQRLNELKGPRQTIELRARTCLLHNIKPDSDPNLVQLTWYALLGRVKESEQELLWESLKAKHPTLRRNGVRFALAFGREANRRTETLEWIVERLQNSPDEVRLDILGVLREALAGLKGVTPPVNWPAVYEKVASNPKLQRDAEAVAVLFGDKEAIGILLKRTTDMGATPESRRAAIELLRPLKLPEFAKTLRTLLDDPAVRTAAIRGLAAFADADTPAAIIKAYPKFTPDEKLDAVQTLAARKEWANALLDAVEKKDVPRADIPVTTARQILALNDKALSARLDSVWGKIAPASQARAALTKKWKELLTEDTLTKASVASGRVLFTKHCGACHKMFGEGQAVGPELTGSQRSNLDYVLENVLDPSAVVPREFQMVNFTTMDDRVISGIVLRETKDAITIRTTNDTVVLPTGDIATRKQTNVSIMPDGLFEQMKPEEVRDLVAYLRAKEQVPLPK